MRLGVGSRLDELREGCSVMLRKVGAEAGRDNLAPPAGDGPSAAWTNWVADAETSPAAQPIDWCLDSMPPHVKLCQRGRKDTNRRRVAQASVSVGATTCHMYMYMCM